MADNDFSERINQLLSNPEALAQMMKLATNFMPQNQAAKTEDNANSDPLETDAREVGSQPADSASTQTDVHSQDTQPDMTAAMKMLGQLQGGPSKPGGAPLPPIPHGDDRRYALLKALKPYLKRERSEKIDMFLNVLQISQLARTAFGNHH